MEKIRMAVNNPSNVPGNILLLFYLFFYLTLTLTLVYKIKVPPLIVMPKGILACSSRASGVCV